MGSYHDDTPSSNTSHHTSSQVQVRQRAVFHKSLPVSKEWTYNCTDLCGCSDDGEQCENVLDDDSDDEINTVLKKMIIMTMMTIMMCR